MFMGEKLTNSDVSHNKISWNKQIIFSKNEMIFIQINNIEKHRQ